MSNTNLTHPIDLDEYVNPLIADRTRDTLINVIDQLALLNTLMGHHEELFQDAVVQRGFDLVIYGCTSALMYEHERLGAAVRQQVMADSSAPPPE